MVNALWKGPLERLFFLWITDQTDISVVPSVLHMLMPHTWGWGSGDEGPWRNHTEEFNWRTSSHLTYSRICTVWRHLNVLGFFFFTYWYISHLKIVLPQLRGSMESYRNENCILQKPWAHLLKRKRRRQQVPAGAVMHSSALGQHHGVLFHPSHLTPWRNQLGFIWAGTQMGVLNVPHSPEQGERYRRDVQAAPPLFLLPHGIKAKKILLGLLPLQRDPSVLAPQVGCVPWSQNTKFGGDQICG